MVSEFMNYGNSSHKLANARQTLKAQILDLERKIGEAEKQSHKQDELLTFRKERFELETQLSELPHDPAKFVDPRKSNSQPSVEPSKTQRQSKSCETQEIIEPSKTLRSFGSSLFDLKVTFSKTVERLNPLNIIVWIKKVDTRLSSKITKWDKTSLYFLAGFLCTLLTVTALAFLSQGFSFTFLMCCLVMLIFFPFFMFAAYELSQNRLRLFETWNDKSGNEMFGVFAHPYKISYGQLALGSFVIVFGLLIAIMNTPSNQYARDVSNNKPSDMSDHDWNEAKGAFRKNGQNEKEAEEAARAIWNSRLAK